MGSSSARTVRAATMLALLGGLLVGTMAIPAHASCAAEPEDAIVDQETVFVATAIEQTDRHARVRVEEIWQGPDLAPTVWLQTSAAELPPWPRRLILRAASSIDVELVPGTRYVIATVDGGFQTNNCLVIEASASVVERLAPEATRQPVASGASGDGPGLLEGTSGIAVAAVAIAAVPVAGWLTYRRLRTARRASRA